MMTGASSHVLWVLFRAVLLLEELEASHFEQIRPCLEAAALGQLDEFNAFGREILRAYPLFPFRHVSPRAAMGSPVSF